MHVFALCSMQAFEEETKRALKKQRLCASQIDAHLDFLLEEAALAKQQLLNKQAEFRRKKGRADSSVLISSADTTAPVGETTVASDLVALSNRTEAEEVKETDASTDALLLGLVRAAREQQREEESERREELRTTTELLKEDRVFAEQEDTEVDNILQGFIHRVRLLNVEKNVAEELKAIHVALSKYAKQIDKVRSV